MPTMSAVSAASKINLVFLILPQLVYTAIVYKVVSVEPIIVEAIFPIKLSTPKVFIISVAMAIEPLPDIGLKMASGIISGGKLNSDNNGEAKFIINSNTPEWRKLLIATNRPIKVGKMFKVILMPS